MRYVSASTRNGPPPSRQSLTARPSTASSAARSLPSTSSPAIPYPTALWASEGAAVCLDNGTEMAYLLFCTKKMTGSLNTAAKFNASWKSPRSEEHTSELQSRFDLVCRLLLEQ